MPSGARSTDRPALVTAPRLWGQTKDNTWLCRVMKYISIPPRKQGGPGRPCRPGLPCWLNQVQRTVQVRVLPSTVQVRVVVPLPT